MSRPRVFRALLPLLVAGPLAVACAAEPGNSATAVSSTASTGSSSSSGSSSSEETLLRLGEPRDLATGLQAPWSIALTDAGEILLSERDTARILQVLPDGGTRVVGTLDDVVARGEGGLLGLAVADGFLYSYATGPDGNRVTRHLLEDSPEGPVLGAEEEILAGIPSATTHNGGRLAFGPDGMLYISTGDSSEPALAQDPESLAGKILRVTPDGSVPEDNPFPGSPVYSLGHRNVQGLAWGADGTFYASEFGASTWDELNIITPGGNYGWPAAEGPGGGEGHIDPVAWWNTADASPSGIAVTGDTVMSANLRGNVLRAVDTNDPARQQQFFGGELGRLRDVAVSPEGDLLVLTNNTDGRGNPREGDDRLLVVPVS
ncbi:PQQ-dependent sugar dehydrogenase [Corynebacterium halotolerans]|uniref:Glucose sorbosone dehydrogenase n=1 Tax=Corynebacterium halotolerans YIM 70093 = DSM 44683 TaxID=1121362 RepID=M1P598_9CORY|nr:PQQ-dependent sugar dehydrogenase [Corynebacterium halotolerans]AGF71841.1 glucose sorbosone dehydrogenase [Corynebacterium halotolerans YIM 70093 = DSM 44683]